MKNKKPDILIVLDLDGTLLNKKKKIPHLTKRYLAKLHKKGYQIVLASGRPARNVFKFHQELKLKTPIIALNGLHLHYPNEPKKDERIYFPPEKIHEVVNKMKKAFKIKNIICETDKEIYITNDKTYLDPKFWLVNMKVVYGNLEDNLKNKVMTFLMELEDKNINQKKLAEVMKDTGCSARCWVDAYQGYVEIYEEHSNKARAIKYLADKLNIHHHNIYAFGDDLNDIEMLTDLPNAYVMKNAKDNIKAISHNVTKHDNEHQGVKKQLKIILKHLR